jgi:hypothetical protein
VFELGGAPIEIDLSSAPGVSGVVIVCNGFRTSLHDTLGGVDREPHECVLDAQERSRVIDITFDTDVEVALVGITLANGRTAQQGGNVGRDGAGIRTAVDTPSGRLRLATRFVKFLNNDARSSGATVRTTKEPHLCCIAGALHTAPRRWAAAVPCLSARTRITARNTQCMSATKQTSVAPFTWTPSLAPLRRHTPPGRARS